MNAQGERQKQTCGWAVIDSGDFAAAPAADEDAVADVIDWPLLLLLLPPKAASVAGSSHPRAAIESSTSN